MLKNMTEGLKGLRNKEDDMTKSFNKLKRMVKMKEVLIMGNVEKDFERLGIALRQTYEGKDYGVCEVTEDELKLLCNDADNDNENTWQDCGWRYCKRSNQSKPKQKVLINNKEITAWGVIPLEEFDDLLQYLCDEMGCSQPKNVCALTKDLAKYNNMKLSELFLRYQEI